ncbi:hypothetical protein CW731_03945 [Polaribacter sp. ALD11]|uniref:hypothetical protein n=1 Tax=Polaribacter sp. ALD11 TaxID=2058137 RepID=UPI000C316254|nr:hypothetical protein [Polaribacter sp. ALD11]AUC84501.1 hypothetical protein CW731_03945 [Polaribacter sp. ALD11]
MEYMYLLVCVLLFIPWLIIFYSKNNLRNRMIKAGLMAAPFGIINMWFRLDYWNAPEIYLFYNLISIEDAIFGFITTGISVSIYDSIFTKEHIKFENSRHKIILLFLFIIFASFFVLNNAMGVNSMFMFCIPLLVLTTYITIIVRRDLLIPSLVTGVFCVLIAIPIYMFSFNYIAPDFWNTYWFLSGKKYGWTVFGNVPVLELLWYFSWGSFSAVLYDYGKGTKKVVKKVF